MIQKESKKHRYSVSEQFTGHGIGRHFHIPPYVFHHLNQDETRKMEKGMVFTIEPILVEGKSADGYCLEDGWAYGSKTQERSAQFEHTIVITDSGREVLT